MNPAVTTFVLVFAVLVAAGLAVALVAVCREVEHMAQALESCQALGNERLAVALRLRPLVRLARAANGVLDARQDAQVAHDRATRAFQDDLAALSHDIRTPLAGAQGYLELHEMAAVADPQKARGYLAAARERLAAVQSLVDDLFEYTKAVSMPLAPGCAQGVSAARPNGKEAVAPCGPAPSTCVYDVLTRMLAAQYPAFAQRGWEPAVDFEDDRMTAAVNPDVLERVFANLVSNALRHGSAAPRIEQRGNRLTFANEVPDPASIDPARLFERFYRANPARTGAGSGLGLAIVAQLCAAANMGLSAQLDASTLSITLAFPQ